MRKFSRMLPILLLLLPSACRKKPAEPRLIQAFPLNAISEILMPEAATADIVNSADGAGSLRFAVPGPNSFRLFEVPLADLENPGKIIFQAKLKSRDLQGLAYLEMWLRFPGKGEFFSKGLDSPITSTTNWISAEIPFFLDNGEVPDLARLNLAVQGRGAVWIDEAKLLYVPK